MMLSTVLGYVLSTSLTAFVLITPKEGPVPFIYAAEAFDLTHREIGMAYAVAVCHEFAYNCSSKHTPAYTYARRTCSSLAFSH